MDADEKLKLVEHNYVVNELFNLTAGTNVASSSRNKQYNWTPRRKKSGYKQFIEEQRKILTSKYPFLSASQIQKRAFVLWSQLSRHEKNAYTTGGSVKKATSIFDEESKTLQSWLSSVHIQNKPICPSTPQTTPKLPIYKRRPPTPKIHKGAYDFQDYSSEEDDLELKTSSLQSSGSQLPGNNKNDSMNEIKEEYQMKKSKVENSQWLDSRNESPEFKVPPVSKKYKEGSMRSTFFSSENPPTVVEDNTKTSVKISGILLSQEKPKCKTFRVSFSDVTSMITFEKTPFEKEMTESEHDCETGYTLRNRQTRTDASADTGYSLRTRPIPESPISRSPRSPLISPLLSLPLGSPRRNRKKEEEEIRQLERKLSTEKERKWIPLLPATPPIFVKLKEGSSQSQSSAGSETFEPESPFDTKEESMNIKSSFQIRPPTPKNSQFQELKTKSEDPNNNSKELENIRDTEPESPFDEHSSKQEEIQSDIQERKVDQISPALVNSDLHLQLSPSESEESSLPDLAGYERWHKGQKPKNGHSSDRCENNEDDIKSRSNEEISCESTNQATEVCKLNEDQYSTASENSRDEVFYDASDYMSDDSEAERDRQLSHLHTESEVNRPVTKDDKWKMIVGIADKSEELPSKNQIIPIGKKDAAGIENTETTTKECTKNGESVKKGSFSGSVGDVPQKSLKQKSITQYFEKYSNKTQKIKCKTDETFAFEDVEAVKENNGVMQEETPADTKNKPKTPSKSTRKASMAVYYPDTSGTPRTPRRLPFRLQTSNSTVEQYDKDSFFHTPQNRSRIPRNMRQTPSRTAPALVGRRRSTGLQERFAASKFEELRDEKVDVVTRPRCETRAKSGKKRNRTSISSKEKCDMNTVDHSHIQKKRRGRPQKNPNENIGKQAETTSKIGYDKGKLNGFRNDVDVIAPVKFYGTRSTASKLQGSSAKLSATKDVENKRPEVNFSETAESLAPVKPKHAKIESEEPKRINDNSTRNNNSAASMKAEKRKICKTVRLSNCDTNTTATKTNAEKSMRDEWAMFTEQSGTLFPALRGLDPFDDFFENDSSSPHNDPSCMKSEGFEAVVRTVHNMREAAMGGSFTSPFNSASKLEKIVHNLPDNVCDSIEFSDVSSQRSADDIEEVEAVQKNCSDTPDIQKISHQDEASQSSTEGVRTFLSDMFGQLTPPGCPRKTNRRLCTSGNGKDENNFIGMFDSLEGNDGIFV